MLPPKRALSKLERSNLLRSGWLSRSRKIVGGPRSELHLNSCMAFIVASVSGKKNGKTVVVPASSGVIRPDENPKMWKSGIGLQTLRNESLLPMKIAHEFAVLKTLE